jgi:putative endonuclease
MACVYILYSASIDRYYIGSTTDLNRRLVGHENGNTPTTRRGQPWICVYESPDIDLHEARSAELKLKRWKNRSIIERIVIDNEIRFLNK